MKKYTVDETAKQINLFDQRFYTINDNDIFNVTGWLEAFPKGNGFKQWLMNTKDPDAVRDEAAQIGSAVHQLIDATLKGSKVKWADVNNIEVWEKYLSWCNFWSDLQTDPNKVLGLKNIKSIEMLPELTEFIVWDEEINAAGTVDKMIKIIFNEGTYSEDGSSVHAILDWKSGNNVYDTAYIQVATYASIIKKNRKLEDIKGYIIQINPILNKKGYRIYPVENIEEEFGIFLATQKLYIRAFGLPKPKYRTYPTEVELKTIKLTEVK